MFGFQMGDLLLQVFGQCFVGSLCEYDMVLCVGGDDFVLLVQDLCCDDDIVFVVDKILSCVNDLYEFGGYGFFVIVLMGISVYFWDGEDVQMLLCNVEMVLVYVKECGGSVYQFFCLMMVKGWLMFEIWIQQVCFGNELCDVFECDEFWLYYQFKYLFDGKKIFGVEVLICWEYLIEGFIFFGDFIFFVEQMGIIFFLGEWVIQEVCQQNCKWQDLGFLCILILVNVLVQQFC